MNQVQVISKPLFFSVNQGLPQYIASTTQECAQYTTWVILSSYLPILSSYSNCISACVLRRAAEYRDQCEDSQGSFVYMQRPESNQTTVSTTILGQSYIHDLSLFDHCCIRKPCDVAHLTALDRSYVTGSRNAAIADRPCSARS
jgi:hypothetical protein